jgi:hypothetical protein
MNLLQTSGVAIGSTVGHAIGGLFGGGYSQPAEQQTNAAANTDMGGAYDSGASSGYSAPKVCEQDVVRFKQCLDQNEGNLTICGWYLDQLKACQQAASRY